jgi:hypothetical protein
MLGFLKLRFTLLEGDTILLESTRCGALIFLLIPVKPSLEVLILLTWLLLVRRSLLSRLCSATDRRTHHVPLEIVASLSILLALLFFLDFLNVLDFSAADLNLGLSLFII